MNLPELRDAASARILVEQLQRRLRGAGIHDFRPPPPEPLGCCGRGCNGCVWEGFFAAMAFWREDAIALCQARDGLIGDSPSIEG